MKNEKLRIGILDQSTMKKIKIISILLFFSGLMVLYNGCKDKCPVEDSTNPDCDSYDPCHDKRINNTFFRVRGGDGGFPPDPEWCEDLIPCDTFTGGPVRFDIPLGNPANATYEWQIGTEKEPRTARGFEIDFQKYLKEKGHEIWIPITLTIRIPASECANTLEEQEKTVTRNIFFTRYGNGFQWPREPERFVSYKYKGYFAHEPNKEAEIEYITFQGIFRGLVSGQGTFKLLVGIPNIDTLLYTPTYTDKDRAILCGNHVYHKAKYFQPKEDYPEVSHYLAEWRHHFINSMERVKFYWHFDNPKGPITYEFIGDRIE